MRTICISDITMKQKKALSLTFKEKLELVKLLDKLGLDCIELAPLSGSKADSLSVKAISQAVKTSSIAIPTGFDPQQIELAWEAVKDNKNPILQIVCPVSSVQMEYLYHLKPAALIEKIKQAIAKCRQLCNTVEFIAQDATRGEETFVYDILRDAIEAGATKICVCDDAGNMLPNEFTTFVENIRANVKNIDTVKLGVEICNKLSTADVCSLGGAIHGADEIKASVFSESTASVQNLVKIIGVKGDRFAVKTNIHTVEIKSISEKIRILFTETKSKNSPFDDGVKDEREENTFNVHDTIEVISKEANKLGYDLNEEDKKNVYETFVRIASKKESVSSREIETIIASSAMQVPPTYVIDSYIINSGNIITATCHMKLIKNGKVLESVSIGDGSVDASFLAIEQITGHHYELDDFQIQSVTEGRAAMGETIVKLRSGGKLYSGRGLSTDIVGSSIHAYINALNKIVYEEENS